MKKFLIPAILLALFLSGSILAEEFNGSIKLGKNVIRIDVGDSDRNLSMRVRRLERAVRQLQDRVFELENDSPISDDPRWTCVLKNDWNRTYIGKSMTKVGAKADAMQKCGRVETSSFNCEEDDIVCEASY